MTDNKLTDKEIVKVLECCSTCKQVLIDAKDLLNRLRARVEYYKNNRDKYQDDVMYLSKLCDELQAENEGLRKDYTRACAERDARIVTHKFIKAEAYKELVGLIKDEITDAIISNGTAIKERVEKHNVNRYEDNICVMCDGKVSALVGIEDFLDNLLKELVGE